MLKIKVESFEEVERWTTRLGGPLACELRYTLKYTLKYTLSLYCAYDLPAQYTCNW